MHVLLLLTALILSFVEEANAADISVARLKGNIIVGIRLEGQIESGDYERLRDAVRQAGPTRATLYLRSPGGSVNEAIRMGRLIRQLRIETDAPMFVPGQGPRCFVEPPRRAADCVCASACFLLYAAGVSRTGHYVGLHRPFLPADKVGAITEEQHDKVHRASVEGIRKYLEEMDIPQRYIDTMLSRSSRQIYFVSLDEAEESGLKGRIPSLDEYLIGKCATIAPADAARLEAIRKRYIAGTLTDADRKRGIEIGKHLLKDIECNIRELDSIREVLYKREFG